MDSTGSDRAGAGTPAENDGDRVASLRILARGVAHALASPVASVAASLRILAEETERLAADPTLAVRLPGLRQSAADAARGAARAGELVQALHLLASSAAARGREPVDLRSELGAAIELARPALSARGGMTLELPPTLPRVTTVPGELGLALTHLLLAVAEAPAAPPPPAVRVAARAAGDRAVVEVTDEGAALTHERLAVARAAIAGAGGELTATGAAGTAVAISLPACADDAPPPRAQAAPAPARGRVLVVDDDPLVGRSMARLLQASHDVTVITSPQDAVTRLERGERWDVMLCDLMMPELSGMDVEERLATSAPDMVPRIVYLTGGAFTDRARAFLAGGRPYLEKPVEAPLLRAKVAELLRRGAG